MFVSKETMEKMYREWDNNPQKELDSFYTLQPDVYNMYQRYRGAYYQVAFSQLFVQSGVKHDDILNSILSDGNLHRLSPYWGDRKLYFYGKNDVRHDTYSDSDISNAVIGPIQLSRAAWVEYHSGKDRAHFRRRYA